MFFSFFLFVFHSYFTFSIARLYYQFKCKCCSTRTLAWNAYSFSYLSIYLISIYFILFIQDGLVLLISINSEFNIPFFLDFGFKVASEITLVLASNVSEMKEEALVVKSGLLIEAIRSTAEDVLADLAEVSKDVNEDLAIEEDRNDICP